MTLKLTNREKLLAANAIGSVKLALTAEEYSEAYHTIGNAEKQLTELKALLGGKLPSAVVTGGADGKGIPVPVAEGFGAGGSSKLSK